jgi:accessory gene regulator B
MQTLAYKLAAGIKSKAPSHPASVEVLEFSILAFLNTFSTIIVAMGISLLTGKVAETAVILVVFAVLRSVSGGLHLKYGWACTLATSTVANVVSFIAYPAYVIPWMTAASLVLCLIYAPSKIQNQTRIPEKYYPLLKIIAAAIIASNFFFASSIVASAFFIQAVLLIRLKGGERDEKQ